MIDPNDQLRAEYDRRVNAWGAEYEYDGPSVLADAVEAAGELIAATTSEAIADEAMRSVWATLVAAMTDADEVFELRRQHDWRTLFGHRGVEEGIGELSAGQELVGLSYYAEQGILPAPHYSLDAGAAEIWIRERIERATALYCLLPRTFARAEPLERLLEKAEARFALDTGCPVTIGGLAALGDLSVKSVRNALTPGSSDTLETTEAGLITNASAARWLSVRERFRSSFWKQMAGLAVELPTEPDDEIEMVFVPEAQDGSYFRPSDRMGQGWKIGSKTGGFFVADYWAALDKLNAMRTPRWRRPSKTTGIHGVVTGVRFRRIPRSEVERELRNLKL